MQKELTRALHALQRHNHIRRTQLGVQLAWLFLVAFVLLGGDALFVNAGFKGIFALVSMIMTGLFAANDARAVYHLVGIQASVAHRSLEIAATYQRWLHNINAVQAFYFALYVLAFCCSHAIYQQTWVLVIGGAGVLILATITLAVYLHLLSLREHFRPRPLPAPKVLT